MRATVSVVTAITFLFVGVFAISQQAQEVSPNVDSSAGNTSYNVSREVFGGAISSAGPGVVWGGIAAIIALALGLLVISGGGR